MTDDCVVYLDMKDCCTVENMQLATADGTPDSPVNCLVCKTCGHQSSFVYHTKDDMNGVYSYIKFALLREDALLPVFRDHISWNHSFRK